MQSTHISIEREKRNKTIWKWVSIILAIILVFTLWISFSPLLKSERLLSVITEPETFSRIIKQAGADTQTLQTIEEIEHIIKKNYIGSQPKEEQKQLELVKSVVDTLQDQYSEYLTKDELQEFNDALNERFVGIGIRFELTNSGVTIEEVFDNSPAQKSGLLAKDIITSIDGTETSSLKSNEAITTRIRGNEGTEVKLKVVRGSENLDFSITRAPVSIPLATLRVENEVAIVSVSSFGSNLQAEMEIIAEKILTNPRVKAILLDLRNNSGGYLDASVDLISFFVPNNTVAAQQKTTSSTQTIRSHSVKNSLDSYPLVVVGNGNSASASEITIGALRDIKNTKFLGTKTFGKGIVQQVFTLKNGDAIKLTVAEWLTPNGTSINKKGIEPDILVQEPIVEKIVSSYDWGNAILPQ